MKVFSRLRLLTLLIALALLAAACPARQSPARATSRTAEGFPSDATRQTSTPPAPAPRAYTLPPTRAAQARAYARAGRWLYFADFAWSVLALLLLLRFGVAAEFRDWAERASPIHFFQLLIFVPCLIVTLALLGLPGDIAGHWLSRHFGQSIEGWGPWLWDRTKGDLLVLAVAIFLVWGFFAVVRRSPRRWWLWAWLASLPLVVFFTFVSPLVIEPIFFDYTPLANSHPALAAELERVVERGGQRIPESRMFLMHASGKLNELNAYVTGIGASSRVVVWDTTIARMSVPEIMAVFGHEMGHYVLHHVLQGMLFGSALLLAGLWLGAKIYDWMIARWGRTCSVRGINDWAGLPALLLLLLLFDFASTPVSNAFSRHLEHQADQYGLEVMHGLIPDVPAVAAGSFQILGDVDLSEPSPSPLVEFWFYTHPSINERIIFANSYDPWDHGQQPEFVR